MKVRVDFLEGILSSHDSAVLPRATFQGSPHPAPPLPSPQALVVWMHASFYVVLDTTLRQSGFYPLSHLECFLDGFLCTYSIATTRLRSEQTSLPFRAFPQPPWSEGHVSPVASGLHKIFSQPAFSCLAPSSRRCLQADFVVPY